MSLRRCILSRALNQPLARAPTSVASSCFCRRSPTGREFDAVNDDVGDRGLPGSVFRRHRIVVIERTFGVAGGCGNPCAFGHGTPLHSKPTCPLLRQTILSVFDAGRNTNCFQPITP